VCVLRWRPTEHGRAIQGRGELQSRVSIGACPHTLSGATHGHTRRMSYLLSHFHLLSIGRGMLGDRRLCVPLKSQSRSAKNSGVGHRGQRSWQCELSTPVDHQHEHHTTPFMAKRGHQPSLLCDSAAAQLVYVCTRTCRRVVRLPAEDLGRVQDTTHDTLCGTLEWDQQQQCLTVRC
jgi:hypothetical protein